MNKLSKCVNCGGGLVYSPTRASVVCEHCDSVYAIPATKKNIKLLRQYTVDYMPEIDINSQNMFVCNTCGSTYAVSDHKVSTRCPNCGDTNISKSGAKTSFPDGIVPFEIDKAQAVTIFEKWLKKRKFAPNDLLALARNGKMVKVYVPVFNINATSVCAYNGMVKKVHTDNDTGTIFSTVHTVQDAVAQEVSNVPLCANRVVNKEFINKIVKVNQEKIVPYSSEYLLDYYGIETNHNIHDLLDEYTKVIEKEREQKIRAKLKDKYDEIVHLTCSTQLKNVSFNYVYVPVFMNHFKYKDKKYHCYISGTSGKVAGTSPKSAGKILALIGGIFLAIGIAALLLLKFI